MHADQPVGATVAATLSLTLGTPSANLGSFIPGVAGQYTSTLAANVISTAGDAALSVSDPSPNATGRLVNGAFAMPQALQVRANTTAFAPLGTGPLTLLTYAGRSATTPSRSPSGRTSPPTTRCARACTARP